MFNGTNGYSLSDIAAVTESGCCRSNSGNGMWGDGGAWWIIILFLFVFCGWGNGGWGGFGGGNGAGLQGALTRADLCQDMNFQGLENGVRGIQQGLCDGFYAQNTNILNGFAGVQHSLATGFAGVDNAVCTLGYNMQQGFNTMNVANLQNTNAIQSDINANTIANMQNTNALQAQIAECCCENRAGQDDIKYQMATDTCAVQNTIQNTTRDIIDNNNANTRSILDFLVKDKISSLESENQSLRLAASQSAQNQYLVNELRPCPVPAYVTCNPWAASYGFNNYNGCGCGCN